VDQLSEYYGVGTSTFFSNETNKELHLANSYEFFTQDYVRLLLGMSKTRVFSRPDKNKTPKQRFEEAINEIHRFIGADFAQEMNFSSIKPYQEMWIELNSYIRSEEQSTSASRKIKQKLSSIFERYQRTLSREGICPCVYGSVRYGDANNNSDIDIMFLVNFPDDLKKLDETVNAIDLDIYAQFKEAHQIRDRIGAAELVVDVGEINSVLLDIAENAATGVDDYEFNRQIFYPFNWITEGVSLIDKPLGQIDEEVERANKLIHTAVSNDPFFELQMCMRMYLSIEKRKQNLERK
jgi:predicted nucleotidyltransferase